LIENKIWDNWHELISAIEGIEDKIRERGILVSLCGDPCADCALTLELNEKRLVKIRLDVETASTQRLDNFFLNQMHNYIASKTHDAFEEFGLTFNLDEINVQAFVNGNLV
jgi:hypothetical protein